jgi:hypothetical protein
VKNKTTTKKATNMNKNIKVTTYAPNKSHLSEGALAAFLSAQDIHDMTVIPGIGDESKKHIIEMTKDDSMPIDSGYALIGVYLALKKKGVNSVEHQNLFLMWLHNHNVIVSAHTVVQAIAEKMTLTFPVLYDRTAYSDEMDTVHEKMQTTHHEEKRGKKAA